eukprot:scaffold492_cov341-Pavlova_lutheri.AAC.5
MEWGWKVRSKRHPWIHKSDGAFPDSPHVPPPCKGRRNARESPPPIVPSKFGIHAGHETVRPTERTWLADSNQDGLHRTDTDKQASQDYIAQGRTNHP